MPLGNGKSLPGWGEKQVNSMRDGRSRVERPPKKQRGGRWGKALSPLLQQIAFYFNILTKSSDAYFFVTDVMAKETLLSENWVTDFALTSRIVGDMDAVWTSRVHPDDQGASGVDYFIPEVDVAQRVRDKNGRYVWVRRRGMRLYDSSGRPYFSAGMMVRMEHLNEADTVTGLLSRSQFERGVRAALEDFRRSGVGGVILVLGLDNFKVVNETYNRFFGNQVLRAAAEQITNILPKGMLPYKLDGDEFGIIMPGVSTAEADAIFQSIQICMSRQQFIDGKMYFCTVSGGTVSYPQGGKDYLVLHKRAEAALDLAKRDGKNRNVIFTREQYNRWMRALAMRDTLKNSVENGCEGFCLFFQPQVEAATQRLIGAEALLRWRNPHGAMVSPMEFVPILEETKMILPLGKWIVEQALKTCRKWREVVPDFHMSINVSYAQIKDVTFLPFVFETLENLSLPSEALTLELTESMIVSDWAFLYQKFTEFRDRGVRIAMDDFGTGYSSLAYLKKLPCDVVKVDREFVRHITSNDFDRHLVEYTVTLCHRVGMQVCMEGVEEEQVYDIVTKDCRADFIQGYLFGRPAAEADFEQQYMEREPTNG